MSRVPAEIARRRKVDVGQCSRGEGRSWIRGEWDGGGRHSILVPQVPLWLFKQ